MAGVGPRGRYAGKTAEERRAERRERLLEAALEVFGGEGYAAASTERICVAAGLSTRQFYEEYANRAQLLTELYDRINDEAEAAVTTALAGSTDPADLIDRAIRAYVTATAADPRRARVAYVVVVGVSPELEAHRRARRHRWAERLAGQAEALGLPPPATPHLHLAIIGAVNALVHEWCEASPRPPLDEIVATLRHLIVRTTLP